MGDFAPLPPAGMCFRRPALIRCTISTRSPTWVGEQEPLRAALDAQGLAFEDREARIDRLQRRDVGRACFLDRAGADERVERSPPRFDLR